MADVVKVIEIMAESKKSWGDAAQQAVAKASKSIHNIKSIYIKELEARVQGSKIVGWRVNGKVSFLLD